MHLFQQMFSQFDRSATDQPRKNKGGRAFSFDCSGNNCNQSSDDAVEATAETSEALTHSKLLDRGVKFDARLQYHLNSGRSCSHPWGVMPPYTRIVSPGSLGHAHPGMMQPDSSTSANLYYPGLVHLPQRSLAHPMQVYNENHPGQYTPYLNNACASFNLTGYQQTPSSDALETIHRESKMDIDTAFLPMRDIGRVTLKYFDLRNFFGRGGKIRFYLAAKQVKYWNEHLPFDSTTEALQKQLIETGASPNGQLPVMMHRGRTFCETTAIMRYLAKRIGEYGANDFRDYLADMMMDKLAYWTDELMTTISELQLEENESQVASYLTSRKQYFDLFEKLLGMTDGVFFTNSDKEVEAPKKWIGEAPRGCTWVDCAVVSTIQDDRNLIRMIRDASFQSSKSIDRRDSTQAMPPDELLYQHPKLERVFNCVCSLPLVKQLLLEKNLTTQVGKERLSHLREADLLPRNLDSSSKTSSDLQLRNGLWHPQMYWNSEDHASAKYAKYDQETPMEPSQIPYRAMGNDDYEDALRAKWPMVEVSSACIPDVYKKHSPSKERKLLTQEYLVPHDHLACGPTTQPFDVLQASTMTPLESSHSEELIKPVSEQLQPMYTCTNHTTLGQPERYPLPKIEAPPSSYLKRQMTDLLTTAADTTATV